METSKGDSVHASVDPTEAGRVSEKNGTLHDEIDMDRMGKLQQLRVRCSAILNGSLH